MVKELDKREAGLFANTLLIVWGGSDRRSLEGCTITLTREGSTRPCSRLSVHVLIVHVLVWTYPKADMLSLEHFTCPVAIKACCQRQKCHPAIALSIGSLSRHRAIEIGVNVLQTYNNEHDGVTPVLCKSISRVSKYGWLLPRGNRPRQFNEHLIDETLCA